MTPGAQPHSVRRKTIRNEPQPLSTTARGGKNMANITLINDMFRFFGLGPRFPYAAYANIGKGCNGCSAGPEDALLIYCGCSPTIKTKLLF